VSTNYVRLVVDLRFEGDYYSVDELVDVASDWIYGGLEDRDDLRGVQIAGIVNPGPDAQPASVQPCRGDAVESWIKRKRDENTKGSYPYWLADLLLGDYRLHADCGVPLSEPTPIEGRVE